MLRKHFIAALIILGFFLLMSSTITANDGMQPVKPATAIGKSPSFTFTEYSASIEDLKSALE